MKFLLALVLITAWAAVAQAAFVDSKALAEEACNNNADDDTDNRCSAAACRGQQLPVRYYRAATGKDGKNVPVPFEITLEAIEQRANYFAIMMENSGNLAEKPWLILNIPISTKIVDESVEKLAAAGTYGPGHIPYTGPDYATGNYKIHVFPYLERIVVGDSFNPTTLSAVQLRTSLYIRSLTNGNVDGCCRKLCFQTIANPAAADLYVQPFAHEVKDPAGANVELTVTHTPATGTTLAQCAITAANQLCAVNYQRGQYVRVNAPLRAGEGEALRLTEFSFRDAAGAALTTAARNAILETIDCLPSKGYCYFRFKNVRPPAGNPQVRLRSVYKTVRTVKITKAGASNTLPNIVAQTDAANPTVLNQCATGCQTSTFEVDSGTNIRIVTTTPFGVTIGGVAGVACGGNNANCPVTVNANLDITYTFALGTNNQALTVTVACSDGTAACGTVTQLGTPANPDGAAINCPGTCTRNYVQNERPVLVANAAEGYIFRGWTGQPECDGGTTVPPFPRCTVSMAGAEAVTATFGKKVVITVKKDITSGFDIPLTLRYMVPGQTTITVNRDLAGKLDAQGAPLTETKVEVLQGQDLTVTEGTAPGATIGARNGCAVQAGTNPVACLLAGVAPAGTTEISYTITEATNRAFSIAYTENADNTNAKGTTRVQVGVRNALSTAVECIKGATTDATCQSKIYTAAAAADDRLEIVIQPTADTTLANGKIAGPGGEITCAASAGGIWLCPVEGANVRAGAYTINLRNKNRPLRIVVGTGISVERMDLPEVATLTADTNYPTVIPGRRIRLRAVSGAGNVFNGWTRVGDQATCTGKNTICEFPMLDDGTDVVVVTATSTPRGANRPVDVYVIGTGRGTVTSNPAGITCPPVGNGANDKCSGASANLLVLRPEAVASTSYFEGWFKADGVTPADDSDLCRGTGGCVLAAATTQVRAFAKFTLLPTNNLAYTFERTINGNSFFEALDQVTPIKCGGNVNADKNLNVQCTHTRTTANRGWVSAWAVQPAAGAPVFFNGWQTVGDPNTFPCANANVRYQSHCELPPTSFPRIQARIAAVPDNRRVLQVVLKGRGFGSVVGTSNRNFRPEIAGAQNGDNINCWKIQATTIPGDVNYGCVKKNLGNDAAGVTYVLKAEVEDPATGRTEFRGMRLKQFQEGKDAIDCAGTVCTVTLVSRVVVVEAEFEYDCGANVNTQRKCGAECVDVLANAEHCGSCNSVCPEAIATCVNGNCRCKGTGLTYVDRARVCVNSAINSDYCGAALAPCEAGQSCVNSRCRPGNPPNTIGTRTFPGLTVSSLTGGQVGDVTKFTLDLTRRVHLQDPSPVPVGEGQKATIKIEVGDGAQKCFNITVAQGSNTIAETRAFAIRRDVLLKAGQTFSFETTIASPMQYLLVPTPCPEQANPAPAAAPAPAPAAAPATKRMLDQAANNNVEITLTRTISAANNVVLKWGFKNIGKFVTNAVKKLA